MSITLRADEVRDLLDVHFTLEVGHYIGDLVTAADVTTLGSEILNQALREVPAPQNGEYTVEDLLEQAVRDCLALIAKVDTKGQAYLSLKEIEALAADPAPIAKELAGLLRGFHQQVVDWTKIATGGGDIAAGLGDLARGLRARIAGNNEGDSPVLPFHASAPGKVLRAASRADLCHALALAEKKLPGDLVTDYSSAAAFLQELSSDSKWKPLADAVQSHLRELRVVLLGSNQAPADWDWKTVVEAIVRSDGAPLARYFGAPATPKQLGKLFGADDDSSGPDLHWSPTQVPVLVAGTAHDGSLVGLLGCLTWT